MGSERLGYVVVTYNRYGGKPFVGFMHDTLDSAMESRDESARVSKAASQERHVVAEVFEVPDTDVIGRALAGKEASDGK